MIKYQKPNSTIVKPYPQTLSPKNPLRPNPNQVPIRPKTKRDHPPITFKHEGGVPQQNSKSKNIYEWSPLLDQPNTFQVDSERKDMG